MASKREIEKLRLLGLGLGILVVPMFFGVQRGRRKSTGPGRTPPPPGPSAAPEVERPEAITEGPSYPQPGPTAPSRGAVQEVTEETLDAAIASNSIVVLDVYTTWCGPCRLLGPALEEVAKRNRHIHFFKMDADKSEGVTSQLGVKGFPTLILFINGEQVENLEAAPPSKSAAVEFLENRIADWLALT